MMGVTLFLGTLIWIVGSLVAWAYLDEQYGTKNILLKSLTWPIGLTKAIKRNPMKWWTVWDDDDKEDTL